MAISSFFVGAPLGYIIQQFLEYKFPGNASKQIGKKMLFSFFISSPIQISLAFTTITLLKGYNISAAKTKIENDLVSTMVTGLVYWPFVGYLNLRYVPVVHRPLVGSFAGMIWNIYMSNQTNREHATHKNELKKEVVV